MQAIYYQLINIESWPLIELIRHLFRRIIRKAISRATFETMQQQYKRNVVAWLSYNAKPPELY